MQNAGRIYRISLLKNTRKRISRDTHFCNEQKAASGFLIKAAALYTSRDREQDH